MLEPKGVIAMGVCACTGGLFDTYPVAQGIDEIMPVDVYVPGCPPIPEGLIYSVLHLQKLIDKGLPRRPAEKPTYEDAVEAMKFKNVISSYYVATPSGIVPTRK
jgi:NADH-quinone oxidoreductase subunit B